MPVLCLSCAGFVLGLSPQNHAEPISFSLAELDIKNIFFLK
jgi:hypothetical protein